MKKILILLVLLLVGCTTNTYTTISQEDAKEMMKEMFLIPNYYETKEELEKAYEEDKIDSYVTYDDVNKKYTIYTDDSDVLETTIASYVATYLESYNRYLGDMELYNNNLSPELIYNNFQVETKSISGEEMSESALMLKMIMGIAFTYIIVSISLATINMATTAIATEKEHGTLETILTLPITTTELLLGKYLATVLIGLISSLVGFVTISKLSSIKESSVP